MKSTKVGPKTGKEVMKSVQAEMKSRERKSRVLLASNLYWLEYIT